MLCPRCNLRETEKSLCSVCELSVTFLKPEQQEITDEEIIRHHVLKQVSDGCRECGSKTFAYEAGVNYEGDLKWYVILVDCGACGKAYEEIMEVRTVNESIENEQQ
tara:strand:- start:1678 stop:1995 length:318 start_codon:yes stop_codon:yes gene_type:complete